MSESKQEKVVKSIIAYLGGKENINNAWHCMTRLRFEIKDDSLIKEKDIKSIPEVMGAQNQNNQYQIIIGTEVESYFEVIASELGINDEFSSNGDKKEKKNLITLFMDIVSGVFGPIVPAIAGAGMIKGLIAGFEALNLVSSESQTIQVLDMLASGVFTFLPFFIAASAAKIFKTNQYLAIAIAAAMQYPTMTNAAAAGDISAFHIFGFIPIPVFNYAGNVIPIIFSVFILSYVQRWVDKVLPKVFRTVFTPTFSLFIAGLIAFIVIGPIGIHLGRGLADVIAWLFDVSPILAGIVVGAIRPVAILTGLHHAMTPIALQNFAEQGYDMLMPMMFMANMAIAGATLAMYRKAKSSNEKSVIVSSSFSAFLGITEPALFGVLTKYKRGLLAATIGSALASAFISAFGVRIYGYILSSIFSLPAYIGEYFIFAILGILIAVVLAYLVAALFAKSNEELDEVKIKSESRDEELTALATGEYIAIDQVADDAFASRSLGDGYAIKPNEDKIFSPVSGEIKTVFPTKHAIGIETKSGLEVLIHMGIDTVSLDGKPFNILVKPGDTVTVNTQIATMDIEEIENHQKDTSIMVVITNMEKVKSLPSATKQSYSAGEKIGEILTN
ncbi:PTS system beta-glucoside-specific EIIBCA component [Paraliobacillus ryukyuensis]|uniref:PTS system beta-glucosides-specific IIC component n=1 Tax=Paraliobacillus ryukyuensis TaxID=200904 RepID=A0A366EBU1_9BACI|nr:glucose PTS transporter subunit IIA [Paraliobacillus ryukyuensis]RBO99853.1 PTS system beta-glucosides-specific IIC component [Paraliobacillus ryukyuensis]